MENLSVKEEDNGYLELQRNPKFFFQTSDTGEILSVFKTVLGWFSGFISAEILYYLVNSYVTMSESVYMHVM